MPPSHCHKTRHFFADPVLRRWILGRLRNRWPVAETEEVIPHHPPYLDALPAADHERPQAIGLVDLPQIAPQGRVSLRLGGQTIELEATALDRLFAHGFDDPAAMAAAHGFVWTSQTDLSPAWIGALWRAWCERNAEIDTDSPIWAPETAAARVAAILDVTRRHGLPGPRAQTLTVLAAHAAFLLTHLDYWGPLATSSSLSAQGHALYRLGLDLGMEHTARLGLTIITEEAKRLVTASGVLREESSHAHLLYTRAIVDAWLAARRYRRAETGALQSLSGRLLAVIPALTLPGGIPLVGDVLPGDAPALLSGLHRDAPLDHGWTATLSADDGAALAALRDSHPLYDLESLRADGWLRVDLGRWAGLWHAAVEGWPFCPGHGHQDIASFELHLGSVPIFVDPGNGEPKAATLYRSAAVHNGLQLNGRSPYPPSRPSYNDAFRRDVAGPQPRLRAEFDGASLVFHGFSRLGGPGECVRGWRFTADSLVIDDFLKGTGRFELVRRLVTPLPASLQEDGTVLLTGPDGLRVIVDGGIPAILGTGSRSTADSTLVPVQVIEFVSPKANLPWRGQITVRLA
jgi:hypothetical protein